MTPIMKRTENKENAVSPVVGVMLMLVVTIVIAAVVTLFATGVVTSTEKAPVAVLDVNIYKSADVGGTMSSTYAPDFTIDHIAGDPLKTSDLKITVDWETNGSNPEKVTNIFTGGLNKIVFTSSSYGYCTYSQPLYLNDTSLDPTNRDWGNAILTVGGHIQTCANYLQQDHYYLHTDPSDPAMTIKHEGSPFFDAVMGKSSTASGIDYDENDNNKCSGGAAEELAVGTLVHVVITHVPSGSILFDKEVRVQ